MPNSILISLKEAAAALRSGRSNGPKRLGPREIKRTRVTLGMSQGQFAAKVGVSVQAVRAWEQGTRSPGLFASVILSDLLSKVNKPELAD